MLLINSNEFYVPDFCHWATQQKKLPFFPSVLLLDFLLPNIYEFWCFGKDTGSVRSIILCPISAPFLKRIQSEDYLVQIWDEAQRPGQEAVVPCQRPQLPHFTSAAARQAGSAEHWGAPPDLHFLCPITHPCPSSLHLLIGIIYYPQLPLLMNFLFPPALAWLVLFVLLSELLWENGGGSSGSW